MRREGMYLRVYSVSWTQNKWNRRTYGPFGCNLFLLKLKTENWKHCSKIIFKCVNNTVGPIFNFFSDEQCTNSTLSPKSCCTWIKKKRENAAQRGSKHSCNINLNLRLEKSWPILWINYMLFWCFVKMHFLITRLVKQLI